MRIKINGRESEVANDITIQEVVAKSGLTDSLIVLELNGIITGREAWATQLKPADDVEIVGIIGGG